MKLLFETRCALLGYGYDWLTDWGYALAFYLFRRKALPGEMRWRWTIIIRLNSRHPFDVRTWPAWLDEPTARAEYERTMKPYRFHALYGRDVTIV